MSFAGDTSDIDTTILQAESASAIKQPRRRFVGKRTAEELAKNAQNDASQIVSSAIQGTYQILYFLGQY